MTKNHNFVLRKRGLKFYAHENGARSRLYALQIVQKLILHFMQPFLAVTARNLSLPSRLIENEEL